MARRKDPLGFLFLCYFFTTVFLPSVWCAGVYTVVAPRVLRPNVDYDIGVSTHSTNEVVEMLVIINGVQDVGGSVNSNQVITVQPNRSAVVRLQMGNVGPGSYNLTVRGIRGMLFENSTSLEFTHKSYSVFIQTDKAIYKPGHTVLFRVLIVNPSLKPVITGAFQIHVNDGKGNRVKQWNEVYTDRGVFSGELPLSDQPVLGEWSMVVTILGQTFAKSFEVAEYVLPKFEVTIDLPPYVSYKEPKIVATIRAKYTYGKPVSGEATLTVYSVFHSSYIQPVIPKPVRKVVKLDGKVNVEVDIVKELEIPDDFERQIRFEVYVTETLTGRRQNASETLHIYKDPYKLELIKTSDSFKPGLTYKAFIKVAYQDDKPLHDDKNVVIVKSGYSYSPEEYNKTSYKIPKNGIIDLVFYPPLGKDYNVLGIEASYLELNQWFSTVERARSPSNSFIQALLLTDKVVVGKDAEMRVTSTEPLSSLTFHVIGRGDIQLSRSLDVGGQSSFTFAFLITPSMSPRARVVVFYVRSDQEVVADALDFEVQGTFQNFVDLKLNPESAEPGKNVSISITTRPNSFVGLLGVDQSVLLLKSGNDITQKDVLMELEAYDSGKKPTFLPWFRAIERRKRRSLTWWPGASTAGAAFESAGVVVLTNAFVFEEFPFGAPFHAGDLGAQNYPAHRPIPPPNVPVVHPDWGPPVEYNTATRPPLAGPYAFSRFPRPVDNRPRVYMLKEPEPTWIFDNITAGYDL